jgi:hypothetical protein
MRSRLRVGRLVSDLPVPRQARNQILRLDLHVSGITRHEPYRLRQLVRPREGGQDGEVRREERFLYQMHAFFVVRRRSVPVNLDILFRRFEVSLVVCGTIISQYSRPKSYWDSC